MRDLSKIRFLGSQPDQPVKTTRIRILFNLFVCSYGDYGYGFGPTNDLLYLFLIDLFKNQISV